MFGSRMRWLLPVLCLCTAATVRAADVPPMKFNDVREVAPGVFFRYSAISPTEPNIFGGSNNIWIVFSDYVVVIDANFPKEAADVIAAIKKTTDKPIRYVLDTHHHGDHAYGNAVFAAAGATIVAQANCARLLRINGPDEFKQAGRGPTGRKDVAEGSFKPASLVFDNRLVLDDGSQRVEFLFFGHAHTAGDAVAYLPKHKILCTGDACVNGSFNFMGHADSASWIRALERMQQLDIKLICPGHGPVAAKDLLEKQQRYFVELRQHVRQGLDAGKDVEDIIKSIDMPWYKEWTTVEARSKGDNIKYVYDELTGRVMAWDLVEEYGLPAGPSPTKDSPGWSKPKRIVVPNLAPARLAELKRSAPEVEFVPVKTADEAASAVADADAVLGFATPEVIAAGTKLRWIQLGYEETGKPLSARPDGKRLIVTDMQGLAGVSLAEQAFALLLGLTQKPGSTTAHLTELHGKTMLLVGLNGVGLPIARRAAAFGMRIVAVDRRPGRKPVYVERLGTLDALPKMIPEADVVVVTCPLTETTNKLFGAASIKSMKPTAYLIDVAPEGVVNPHTATLALQQHQLAGVGLIRQPGEAKNQENAHLSGLLIAPPTERMEGRQERLHRLWRENVRRFVAGEPLLSVVRSEGSR